MNLNTQRIILIILLLFNNVSRILSRVKEKVPCPDEVDVVCVECKCTEANGFNSCEAIFKCPKPVSATSKIRRKDTQAKCPYGKKFIAQCALCQCSGDGGDHCAFCYALPVRRSGQPENLNRRLPQVTDNRLFNYEINGWEVQQQDEK